MNEYILILIIIIFIYVFIFMSRKNMIYIEKENGESFYKVHESEPFERDRAELLLLKSFLDLPNFNKIDLCTISEATNVMKIIDAVKDSHECRTK